jgi:hypothetical protein
LPKTNSNSGDKLDMMRIFFVLMISFLASSAIATTGAFTASQNNLRINDVYAFTSYENGREAFVTIIANYAQAPTNEFGEVFFNPNANYEIHIDSDGNGIENQTYRFTFKERLKEELRTITILDQEITIPFLSFGNLEADENNVFKDRTYEIELVRNQPSYRSNSKGPNRKNTGKRLRQPEESFDELTDADQDARTFDMPENLIDTTSFSDYTNYASNFTYDLDLRFKKCEETAKVFVGQRQASFQGNLSGIDNNLNFDFTATNGSSTSATDSVLTIALELPKSCLDLPQTNSTIAVWASVNNPARSITRTQGSFGRPNLNSKVDFVQVDRMGHPFVKDFLIGYNEQIDFSQRRARFDEKRFIEFFEYPALAELIENQEGTNFTAPNLFPREDMNDFYLFGFEGINRFSENKKAKRQREFEALRLNTTTASVVAVSQNSLGLIGGDNAGYPNGRRPGDDVVDIFFRNLMGFFLEEANAPDKNTVFSDGVDVNATDFADSFPYLNAPNL